MIFTSSPPDQAAGNQFGFDVWMERALTRAKRVRKDWGRAAVHELRVVLRRCRTMADALWEIAPNSGWRRVKKESRELFHVLGDLRDVQVEQRWVKRLAPSGGSARKHMLRVLRQRERRRRARAASAVTRFDTKGWRRLARKLTQQNLEFPTGSIAFKRLALDRLNEATGLYKRARMGSGRVAWHHFRIGMKRLRYIIENFLPQHYEAWAPELKRMQDALGDVHDLDVLRFDIKQSCEEIKGPEMAALLKKTDQERMARLNEFRAWMSGPNPPWRLWRAELSFGSGLKATAGAKRSSASAG